MTQVLEKRVCLSSGITWKGKAGQARMVSCPGNQMEIKLTIAALPEAIKAFKEAKSR